MAISPKKKRSKKAAGKKAGAKKVAHKKAASKKTARKKTPSKKAAAGRAKPAHVRHIEGLAKADPKLKRLVAKYGVPKPIAKAAFAAAAVRPGDICMETDCVDGKKIVMRRDNSGNCTEYSEVDC